MLPGLSLTVPPGQTVALVGTTGAGKTTIAKLIARFYDPDSGSVTLDGIDLRSLTQSGLRRHVVMVTQENSCSPAPSPDNIRFGRPTASDAEVRAAAAAVGADEFIATLPDGYDTDVAKRGGRLSAGQRQLVAFARAFLADPAVLILDEATSSLDIPSERLVQRALRTVLAGRTALIIAHRLSTVEVADRVLVLEHGRVVEDGPPTQLIGSGGHYAGLHRAWVESLAQVGSTHFDTGESAVDATRVCSVLAVLLAIVLGLLIAPVGRPAPTTCPGRADRHLGRSVARRRDLRRRDGHRRPFRRSGRRFRRGRTAADGVDRAAGRRRLALGRRPHRTLASAAVLPAGDRRHRRPGGRRR